VDTVIMPDAHHSLLSVLITEPDGSEYLVINPVAIAGHVRSLARKK
jgi:hypothetical protein